VGAAAVASMGFAATLLLQERLIALTGEEVRGHALGLHATGMKAMQAIGATLAGLTAKFLPVGTAMTTLAVASLAVIATLSPGLRLSNPQTATRAAARRDVTMARLCETPAEIRSETPRSHAGKERVSTHQRNMQAAFYASPGTPGATTGRAPKRENHHDRTDGPRGRRRRRP
jgi:hypothetical protein